ncbi:MAG: DNA/RNA nuclease SfsA [Lachnospiraceae bacterium]|nr:DNA/RNA nuclease SfsA [Lachnospiraceae bacterium]
MKYNKIEQAVFLERPNRFIAYAELNGERVKCHVKNTGRCRELLIPEKTVVYLEDHGTETKRATRYSLITVEKTDSEGRCRMINMDSQAPNQIAWEWINMGKFREGITDLRKEQKFGNSRFDLAYECRDGKKGYVEVKGVTLEDHNIVRFPDAPTERGIKHIHELMAARNAGFEATLLFVVQMKDVMWLEPNYATHAAFGEALLQAKAAGVQICAIDCHVTPDSLTPGEPVLVRLLQ